jgi:hypothetical protein
MIRSERHGYGGPEWASYHIFYQVDRDRLLLRMILPAMRELWLRRQVSSFFFIRYGMGGPHDRLRLLCPPCSQREVEDFLTARAMDFFRNWPSSSRLNEHAIREHNRRLAASDPGGHDEISTVYPDNSIVKLPFRPEVERYGGVSLSGFSLAFFAVSSACVLRCLALHGEEGKSRLLAWAARLLLRQAIGSATEREELGRLVAYAAPSEPGGPSALLERADAEFDRRSESYRLLLREELGGSRSRDVSLDLDGHRITEAARRLAFRIRDADASSRWRILSSQLHMTANRLGINTVEEVYLGRILARAVGDLARSRPALLRRLKGAGTKYGDWKDGGLEDLVSATLADLFAPSHEESQATSSITEVMA